MPLPVPAMPTPVPLPDAQALAEELQLPTPTQMSEPLLQNDETRRLDDSRDMAEKQKMAQADFIKALNQLIARKRNPNVPDLTIDEAVRTALKQNPNILNAVEQIRLTQGQFITIRAQAIPQLTIGSSYNQQGMELASNGRGGPTELVIPVPNSEPIILRSGNPQVQNKTWNLQFAAQQLLFDGGAVVAGIRGAIAVENSAFFALRANIDQVIAQVKINFFQIVLNRALIVAQEQSVALLEQQLKDQQNRFEAGTVPRFNVLQAEVALANAKPPLIQAENNYRVSLYQLVQLLGMDYPAGHPSEVPFNVVGELAYQPRNIDTDQSIRVAIARNPALKAQRQDILAQAANVSAQYAGFLPTINATAGYQIQNNLSSQSLTEAVGDWFFGATGTWPIFDGGATAGRVKQARAQLDQSKINYDNAVRQVILNVQQAISNLQQARETIDSQTASVVQATEALRLAQERLDAGAGTQLDVLNAQVQLLQSQTTVLQARYDYIQATAQYDQALSLDTNYEETFDDPLTRQNARRFQKITADGRPQPELPGRMKNQDPIKPILQAAPSPTPRTKKPKAGISR